MTDRLVTVPVGALNPSLGVEPGPAVSRGHDRCVGARALLDLDRHRLEVARPARGDHEQGQGRAEELLLGGVVSALQPVQDRVVRQVEPPFGPRRRQGVAGLAGLEVLLADGEVVGELVGAPEPARVRPRDALLGEGRVLAVVARDLGQLELLEQRRIVLQGLRSALAHPAPRELGHLFVNPLQPPLLPGLEELQDHLGDRAPPVPVAAIDLGRVVGQGDHSLRDQEPPAQARLLDLGDLRGQRHRSHSLVVVAIDLCGGSELRQATDRVGLVLWEDGVHAAPCSGATLASRLNRRRRSRSAARSAPSSPRARPGGA